MGKPISSMVKEELRVKMRSLLKSAQVSSSQNHLSKGFYDSELTWLWDHMEQIKKNMLGSTSIVHASKSSLL